MNAAAGRYFQPLQNTTDEKKEAISDLALSSLYHQ